jgi:hypothetical protein
LANIISLGLSNINFGPVISTRGEQTKAEFQNCNFYDNVASSGGVFQADFGSLIECKVCEVKRNFATRGGISINTNKGYVIFRDSFL